MMGKTWVPPLIHGRATDDPRFDNSIRDPSLGGRRFDLSKGGKPINKTYPFEAIE